MASVIVELEQHQGLSWPTYQFNLQNSIIGQNNINEYTRTVTHALSGVDTISITYIKNPNETVLQNGKILRDQTLTIKNIYVDDILLDLNLMLDRAEFLPNYNQQFLNHCRDNNIPIDMGPMHVGTFFHSGTWVLPLAEDFWAWYLDARNQRDNQYSTLSQKEKELYLGNTSEHHQLLLNKLQDLLK